MAAIEAGKQPPYTVLLVTHELNEAFYCCDRVIGLSQYWKNERKDGVQLGATKVYDKCAPIYHPGDRRNYDLFAQLVGDLREVVFNEANPVRPNDHVSFWDDLVKGVGTGVTLMQNGNGQ